jgi:hypothetical protein
MEEETANLMVDRNRVGGRKEPEQDMPFGNMLPVNYFLQPAPHSTAPHVPIVYSHFGSTNGLNCSLGKSTH